jgi:hypothetical protein
MNRNLWWLSIEPKESFEEISKDSNASKLFKLKISFFLKMWDPLPAVQIFFIKLNEIKIANYDLSQKLVHSYFDCDFLFNRMNLDKRAYSIQLSTFFSADILMNTTLISFYFCCQKIDTFRKYRQRLESSMHDMYEQFIQISAVT